MPGTAGGQLTAMRLGDSIATATTAVGVSPCGGCKRRAESLNRMFEARSKGPATATGEANRARAVSRGRTATPLVGPFVVGACSLALRRRIKRAR